MGEMNNIANMIAGILTSLAILAGFFTWLIRAIVRSNFDSHQSSLKEMMDSSGKKFDQKLEAHAAESRGSMAVITNEISAINSKCTNMLDFIKTVDKDTKKNADNIASVSTRVARIEGGHEARFEQRG